MAQLVPSILEKTPQEFLKIYNQEVKLPALKRLHVDFGDGIFIENKLLEVGEMPALNPAFEWEAHLMLKAPKDFFEYQLCGFKTIMIHYEAYESEPEIIDALKEIRKLGLKTCLVVNPATPISIFSPFYNYVDQYCIMGVVPGKQGQVFIEDSLEKINQLRQQIPNAIIEIDGGVNETNIKKIAESGVDYIILGSAITKAQNMPEAYEKIQKAVS